MSLVSLAWNLVPFPLSVNQSVVGGGGGGGGGTTLKAKGTPLPFAGVIPREGAPGSHPVCVFSKAL